MMKLKTTITNKKELQNRMNMTEENASNSEDIPIEITKPKNQRIDWGKTNKN